MLTGVLLIQATIILFANYQLFPWFIQTNFHPVSQCIQNCLKKLAYQLDYPLDSPWVPGYARMPKTSCRSFGEWLRKQCSFASNSSYLEYSISDLLNLIDGYQDYLQPESRYLINCGAQDGRIAIELQEGFYAKLKENLPASNIAKVNQALEPHTVQHIFRANAVPQRPLLFKIDIDGYDYPVVRALFLHPLNNCRTEFEPAFVMVEMNEKVPPPINFYTRYRVPYAYTGDHLYGASITAWTRLLSYEFGYVLLGTYDWNNLMYIRYDLAQHLKLLYQFPHNSHDVWFHGYWNRPERDEKFPWNKNVTYWSDSNTTLLTKNRNIENYLRSTRTFTENINCSYFIDVESLYLEQR
ncbi:unnamed protein product [Rotaria socialis]|uniref:Methyltransferase FkbM domain-containing protein n=1 Tax=Rotaria socialis TaxID=392032 RepID=A0A818V067_9BILA|nr:unnamed protein product [Rotaria socialis]